jgi:hypothetical protein
MEQKTVSKMELTTTSEGVPLGLVTAIQLWADARTDASSARRRDLIRDKISTLGAFFGDDPPQFPVVAIIGRQDLPLR